MKAIMLAAGLGSRISELTNSVPKAMIKISNKYIFEIVIDKLIETGINDLIIVIGYKANLLKTEINKIYKNVNVKISYVRNEEYASTNTMEK